MDYSRKLLNQKRDLMTDSKYVKNMMHPAEAEATLYDLIVCKQMTFKPAGADYSNYQVRKHTTSKDITVHSFDVRMQFMHFLNQPQQVQYQAHLFLDGVGPDNPWQLPTFGEVRHWVAAESRQDTIGIHLTIPKQFRPNITDRSELVFAVRLAIEGSRPMHFPYPMDGRERWLGARVRLKDTLMTLDTFIQQKRVQIEPLDKLLNDKYVWSR